MSAEGSPSLQRLLRAQQVSALLESCAGLAPEQGFAVICADRRPLASAGSWPQGTLEKAVLTNDGCRRYTLLAGSSLVGELVVRGEPSAVNEAAELALQQSLSTLIALALEKREITAEALQGYREVNLLYRAGETIGRSLDPNAIPQLMLHEATSIKADAGFVLLGDIASRFGDEALVKSLYAAVQVVIDTLWQSGQPAIITDIPRAGSDWSSVLWAPLHGSDRVLGGIVLGRRQGQPVFAANDEKMLVALAAPSALALQNAQLYTDLEETLNQTLEMKTLMDNVLSSVVSGVLTTDPKRQITLCNAAAASLLGLDAAAVVGRPLARVLPPHFSRLGAIIAATTDRGTAAPGANMSVTVPGRGPLHLFVSCAPIRDAQGERRGAAVVINDLTEQREVEAERERIRETFGRVVAPRVRDRLLAEPGNLRMDGSRHTITVLFADLHDFTPFCERTEPETLFRVLNSYLSAAAQAVLDQEGTLDKFIGDAVMAFWNAPDGQPDHALRAVRAALAMAQALRTHSTTLLEGNRLDFSIGIHTGEAIVGNVGTAELFNYTAIGDTVNMAQRLESVAEPGRTLLSEATYRAVAEHVAAEPRGEMQLKGRQQPVAVYELKDLRISSRKDAKG